MKKYDVVVLTDSRYINPIDKNTYINNVLLEDELVIDALKEKNLSVIKKDWNDPIFDWKTTRTVLFRSTWDYFDKFELFKKWFDETKNNCLMINSHESVEWNIDKHYLLDLQEQQIPIPKSEFIKKGSSVDLLLLMQEKNWNEIVVKPTISGAAKNTFRLKKEELSQFDPTWKNLINNEDFIVQEFQNNVITKGEVAMMVIGGKYTHAVLKMAKKGDFRVQDDFGGSIAIYSPSEKMVKLAEKCSRILSPIPPYARVDIIWDNSGDLAVSELELIEPELWFRLNPNAAQKLAEQIDLILSEKN
jgi:glutathione synthase/RimK-type ligase-like ATP-grasp enzyme